MGRYHLSDPDAFYTRTGAWTVAQDPDLNRTTTTSTLPGGGTTISSRARRISPQYLLTQLPGDDDESFLIFRPFVPVSASDQEERTELTAFMVARSDPGEYGKLTTFVLPTGSQVDGPVQAAANMDQDEEVSRQRSLLNQSGSSARLGNLVIVPIEESLLYVRPFYVEATTTQIPEIRYVVASFKGQVALSESLEGALSQLFEGSTSPPPDAPPDPSGAPTPPSSGGGGNVAELLARAVEAFDQADRALRNGDLATYERREKEGRDLVRQARAQQTSSSSSSSSTTSTSTSTTSTTQPNDA